MLHWSERWKNGKSIKLISASWFSFPRYNWPLSRRIQKLKTLAPIIGVEKSVIENLIGEKEKWTNKGNDKEEDDNSLLLNTTSHTTTFIPNIKILGKVVPEKSLTQIFLSITLE